MKKATLKALKGSIQKWKRIVKGVEIDEGTDNCPLCQLFVRADCTGCPVAKKTGFSYCSNTPYSDWEGEAWGLKRNGAGYKHTKRSLKAAKAEVAFLKSLLPKD